jgi:hypothetical protein
MWSSRMPQTCSFARNNSTSRSASVRPEERFRISLGLRIGSYLGVAICRGHVGVWRSIARVSAGAFEFLIFNHAFDGRDLIMAPSCVKVYYWRTPNALCPRLSMQEQRHSPNDAPPECIRPQLGDLDAYPESCVASA